MQTVQIIYNIFRQRPAELFFGEARRRAGRDPGARAAVLGDADRQDDPAPARSPPTTTAPSIATARRSTRARPSRACPSRSAWRPSRSCARWCPAGRRWPAFALRWILMNEAVTCVIPGGKRPAQVDDNCAAADLPRAVGRHDGEGPRPLRAAHPEVRSPVLVSARPSSCRGRLTSPRSGRSTWHRPGLLARSCGSV